jgi:hypothetical protein
MTRLPSLELPGCLLAAVAAHCCRLLNRSLYANTRRRAKLDQETTAQTGAVAVVLIQDLLRLMSRRFVVRCSSDAIGLRRLVRMSQKLPASSAAAASVLLEPAATIDDVDSLRLPPRFVVVVVDDVVETIVVGSDCFDSDSSSSRSVLFKLLLLSVASNCDDR